MDGLKKIRKARKLTLAQVAPEVGCSIANLSRIERGEHEPHGALRKQIEAWMRMWKPKRSNRV